MTPSSTRIIDWGIPDAEHAHRLAGITQPTLVANGDNDIMIPTPNTHAARRPAPERPALDLPRANHGFLFQYPAEFAAEVNHFLG